MNELVDVLNWIHNDLALISVVLICFVLFKDCHGYSNSGIVDELKNIKSAIQHKKREGQWIVRCKDCKHRYDNDQKCPYCNECGGREYPPDDWFCADGERKTDY